MNLYKLLLTFLLLFFCSTGMQGQAAKEYVYVDSSLLYPDEKESDTILEEPEEDTYVDTASQTISYAADTSLLYNELKLSRDSMRILQHSKQFAYAKVMDSLLKDLQKKQLDASNIEPEKPSLFEQLLSSDITKFIFWTLACFFVLFIIYKLFFTEGFFQRQSSKTAVDLLEEDDRNVNGNADYDKQVNLAISNKNYRLATRYLYLQTIQKLSGAGAISFAADKTNSQYLYELSAKPYKNEFASLTLNYEYVWYGEFLIDEIAFAKLHNRFKQFNNQLKNS